MCVQIEAKRWVTISEKARLYTSHLKELEGPMPSSFTSLQTESVSAFPIEQATSSVFPDLYFRQTFLFFIESGSKRVVDKNDTELIAEAGDLLMFPPESMVTMENRPVMENNYRALGMAYSNECVLSVFPKPRAKTSSEIQIVRSDQHQPAVLLPLIKETLSAGNLPDALRIHRLMEPLIWLKDQGFHAPVLRENSLLWKVRGIIEKDLSHSWTAEEVASSLAMSESSMRRHLAKEEQGFSKILLNTRLEYGLALLQTTSSSVSEITFECGFKTPSHFADLFKKRFGLQPRSIRQQEN